MIMELSVKKSVKRPGEKNTPAEPGVVDLTSSLFYTRAIKILF